MPQTKKSVLHFCGSCCVTLGCWGLWIILAATLGLLGYIALARELPVPAFLLQRFESRLAESNIELQFSRARFDPTGKVLFEDVRLRARQFDDPLLTCRFLYAEHDWWSLLAGRTEPREIRVEGAALHLPAMLSPSGTTEPILRDLAATVHYHDRAWQIDQFVGRLGPLALSVDGEIIPPSRPGATRHIALEEIVSGYLRTARQVAPLMHRLEAFETPSVSAHLTPTRVDVLVTSGGAHHPWDQPVVTGPFAVATTLPLGQAGAHPVRLHVSVARADYRESIHAEQLRAIVRAEINTVAFAARALDVQAAAGELRTGNETVIGPTLQAELAAWPRLDAAVQAQVDGEFIAAEVAAQLEEKSARVHAAGRVAPGLISRVLTEHTPRAAPYFVFGDPVRFEADAELAPGWKFARLASRVDARRLNSHGVGVTAARGRIDIEGLSFLAHDAYAEIGPSHARGSYWMDFSTTEYRMLLDGRLRPPDIAGWFRGDWWQNFWQRFFVFGGPPPEAEVDVRGRWREPWRSNNFVHAHARNVTVWGGDFEEVDATVFVRPNFAHAWNLDAHRAQGAQRLSGWFKRTATGPGDPGRFEFDFTGNPDSAALGRLLEGRANDVLATLQFQHPPELHAWGAIDQGVPRYDFTGAAREPLHYFGFPLESAAVTGSVAGSDIELREIVATAAGGTARGRASLTGPANERNFGFEVFLNGAALGRTIHAFEEFQAARAGRPYVPTPESKFLRKAAGSQLDVAFSAQGTPGHIETFRGTGNASLTGAQLGEVHLFGLLSQALSGLSLSFSSLKLDAARASFEMRDGAVFFPDLKVTGPSAVIDAKGKYSLVDNALDFNAKFKPYEQPGSLLAVAVSLVVNPLTSILELKLSGPLGDPKWSVSVSAPSSTPTTPESARPESAKPDTKPPPAAKDQG